MNGQNGSNMINEYILIKNKIISKYNITLGLNNIHNIINISNIIIIDGINNNEIFNNWLFLVRKKSKFIFVLSTKVVPKLVELNNKNMIFYVYQPWIFNDYYKACKYPIFLEQVQKNIGYKNDPLELKSFHNVTIIATTTATVTATSTATSTVTSTAISTAITSNDNENNINENELNEEKLLNCLLTKYNYAGFNVKWMFNKTTEEVIADISMIVATIPNKEILFQSNISVLSTEAVHSITIIGLNRKELYESIFVSNYIIKLISKYCTISFVRSVTLQSYIIGNLSYNNHIFELDWITHIRNQSKMNNYYKIFQFKTGVDITNNEPIDCFHSLCVHDFYTLPFDRKTEFHFMEGYWFIPLRYNYGGYDCLRLETYNTDNTNNTMNINNTNNNNVTNLLARFCQLTQNQNQTQIYDLKLDYFNQFISEFNNYFKNINDINCIKYKIIKIEIYIIIPAKKGFIEIVPCDFKLGKTYGSIKDVLWKNEDLKIVAYKRAA